MLHQPHLPPTPSPEQITTPTRGCLRLSWPANHLRIRKSVRARQSGHRRPDLFSARVPRFFDHASATPPLSPSPTTYINPLLLSSSSPPSSSNSLLSNMLGNGWATKNSFGFPAFLGFWELPGNFKPFHGGGQRLGKAESSPCLHAWCGLGHWAKINNTMTYGVDWAVGKNLSVSRSMEWGKTAFANIFIVGLGFVESKKGQVGSHDGGLGFGQKKKRTLQTSWCGEKIACSIKPWVLEILGLQKSEH